MLKYIFIIFISGCVVKTTSNKYNQYNFDYSESLTYDCKHNSDIPEQDCNIEKK